MPDPSIDREISAIRLDHPAVNEMAGPHDFLPSEFAPESGRCDRCGGGPLAEIHQKPVDQLERIANALERLVTALEAECEVNASLIGITEEMNARNRAFIQGEIDKKLLEAAKQGRPS